MENQTMDITHGTANKQLQEKNLKNNKQQKPKKPQACACRDSKPCISAIMAGIST